MTPRNKYSCKPRAISASGNYRNGRDAQLQRRLASGVQISSDPGLKEVSQVAFPQAKDVAEAADVGPVTVAEGADVGQICVAEGAGVGQVYVA